METCKNCDNKFTGKFCNACGQKMYTDSDKSLHHIFTELFHFLTHFEGTFFVTLKIIFTKPGKLSLEYCNGVRKKYFKPISFYLLIVIVYLIIPMARGLNPSFSEMKSQSLFGIDNSDKIENIKLKYNYSDEMISAKYHKTSDKISKILLFIFIPFGALVLYLLSFKRNFIFDYFIFSTEINTFFILSFYILLPILLIPFYYMDVFKYINLDNILISITSLIYFIYLSKAFNTYFKEKISWSILRAMVFPVLHFLFMAKIYRFILYYLSLEFL